MNKIILERDKRVLNALFVFARFVCVCVVLCLELWDNWPKIKQTCLTIWGGNYILSDFWKSFSYTLCERIFYVKCFIW